jgi:hypothetical protein
MTRPNRPEANRPEAKATKNNGAFIMNAPLFAFGLNRRGLGGAA